MEGLNRLALFLIKKETIEATFKLLSYLAASALVLGLAKYTSTEKGWVSGIPFILLFLFLVMQSFFYGLQTIIFPAGTAIWATVNYIETMELLHGKKQEHRLRILKKIVFSKPGMFLLASYIALFYILNGVLGVLISKSGIA